MNVNYAGSQEKQIQVQLPTGYMGETFAPPTGYLLAVDQDGRMYVEPMALHQNLYQLIPQSPVNHERSSPVSELLVAGNGNPHIPAPPEPSVVKQLIPAAAKQRKSKQDYEASIHGLVKQSLVFVEVKGNATINPSKSRNFTNPDGSAWKCAQCFEDYTTDRREGPAGPKTLCNRCGLRWKKKIQESEVKEVATEAVAVRAKEELSALESPPPKRRNVKPVRCSKK